MKYLRRFLYAMVVAALINLTITTTIDRLKNPSLTGTQLFLRIPKSFMWSFNI